MTKDIDTEAEFFARGKRLARLADQQARVLAALQHLSESARIAALARHVWDAGPDAETFLNTAHPLLDGRTPLEAATTRDGVQRVEDILWRIVFGIPI
ncbi:Protein of unknown function [Burkholderia sp. D7]|jgi:uncharacterized protein (DUF2384 family)|nr:Protein of unknown function [Burkholderia sp. D7]